MGEKNKKIITIITIGIFTVLVMIFIFMILNSNRNITLTKDNYNEYFEIWMSDGGDYGSRTFEIEVNPISSKFNYEDVEIEMTLNGKYRYFNDIQDFDDSSKAIDRNFNNEKVKIKCNINGKGKKVIDTVVGLDNFMNAFDNVSYEVISVQGKLKLVK